MVRFSKGNAPIMARILNVKYGLEVRRYFGGLVRWSSALGTEPLPQYHTIFKSIHHGGANSMIDRFGLRFESRGQLQLGRSC